MTTILSTRKLSPSQEAMFLNSGIAVVQHDGIRIKINDFDLSNEHDYYIFTSGNAVKSYLNKTKNTASSQNSDIQCLCVGKKTRSYLIKNGLHVIKMAENASELANFIVKSVQNASFLLLTGNKSRPELRQQLSHHKIAFEEVEVYTTTLTPKKLYEVQSFTQKNELRQCAVFCIGETTAREAKKFTSNVRISSETTVESVIELTINSLSRTKKEYNGN
jgi:uroporphyrinogen-III synthase